MVEVTLLGTSALLPLPDRALAATALTCSGETILFDCGEGTQTAARKAGVNMMDAGVIALTHYHGDHIFGLPGLLQTLHSYGREKPLVLYGPGDIERELAPILQLAGALNYPVLLQTIPPEGVQLADMVGSWPKLARLSAFPTCHRVVSQGYVFTLDRAPKFLPDKARALGIPPVLWKTLQYGEPVVVEGRTIEPDDVLGTPRNGIKVVVTGDTTVCDALERASENADLLICEATYAEDEQLGLAEERGHMNFALAGKLAAKAKVRRLLLTHYSQRIADPEEWKVNAQRYFDAVECGFDGMRTTLSFEN